MPIPSKHQRPADAATWNPPPQPTYFPITTIIPTIPQSVTLTSIIQTHTHQTIPTKTTIIFTDKRPSPKNYDIDPRHKHHPIRILELPPEPNAHPVAVICDALDAATAIATTEYVLYTHDDVWLNHPEVIQKIYQTALEQNADIVGYMMSPRNHVTDEWYGMPSHTLTLMKTETIRHHRLRWNYHAAEAATLPTNQNPGWPDTETNIGRQIKKTPLTIHWLGYETNDPHFKDQNITHRRSLTSHLLRPEAFPLRDAEWIRLQQQNAQLWTNPNTRPTQPKR